MDYFFALCHAAYSSVARFSRAIAFSMSRAGVACPLVDFFWNACST